MRQILLGMILALFSSAGYAQYYQYAQFSEIRFDGRNGAFGIVLGFSTDPGLPITVMVEEGGQIKAVESAYKQLFERAKWRTPNEYDYEYVLNVLGSKGWEVIDVKEIKETIFTEQYPATRKEYLLKKVLQKPNF